MESYISQSRLDPYSVSGDQRGMMDVIGICDQFMTMWRPRVLPSAKERASISVAIRAVGGSQFKISVILLARSPQIMDSSRYLAPASTWRRSLQG